MSRHLCVLSVISLLLLAGCGGGDSTDSSGASGASGAAGASAGAASYDITVGEFIADSQDQKTQILKDYAADTPECDADVDDGFVLQVSGSATNVNPSSQLSDLLSKNC